MSVNDLLANLNDMQREAVVHDKGPLLILAGAGSGKTRVLTHRIAYLIAERDVSPYSIIALTFTNKAAGEMKERVQNIVGPGAENIWVSTFHSSCVRILRRYIDYLGYDRSFVIYDTDDQKSLMKDIFKLLNVDSKQLKEKTVLGIISSAKDELIGPEEYAASAGQDRKQRTIAQCYIEYQKRLKANNALDFDDLIFKTVELFKESAEALDYYRRRFRYILVDEYQDTNHAQFELIRLLAEYKNESGIVERNLCVVGDDDQSIYKFRGADIRNILDFERWYPTTRVIRLEQNYRSTSSILNVANGIIHNNTDRKDKTLWTDNPVGETVGLHHYGNDNDEASGVVSTISAGVREGFYSYRDYAILYRTNAQSRVFEEKLIFRNIPYRIIGAQNYYQRREIKDMLAYLRTIDSGLDSVAVKRIINVPKRGIGLATLERVEVYAEENNMSLYEALKRAEFIPGISRAVGKIQSFVALIEIMRSKLAGGFGLKDIIDEILEATQYIDYLAEEDDKDKVDERIENINELVSKMADYEDSLEESDEAPTLKGFLDEVALVADIDGYDEETDVVVLMTIHSAKGLEFPNVFMVGMEEGIFPGYMTINSDNPREELEEERRLCYVGITRAKEHLQLSCCQQRMMRGEIQFNAPSRFLKEIPRNLLQISGNQSSGRLKDSDSLQRRYGGRRDEDRWEISDDSGSSVNSGRGSSYGSDFGRGSGGYGSDSGRGSGGNRGYGSDSGRGSSYGGGSRSYNSGETGFGTGSNPGFGKSIDALLSFAGKPGTAGGASSPFKFSGSTASGAPGMSRGAGALEPDYKIGDRVRHSKFGVGTVADITMGSRDYEVTVDFESGRKKMLASFAKLVRVDG